MTRKIPAAMDGSKTSETVLPYLEELLWNEDADVTLVRVAHGGRHSNPGTPILTSIT